MKAAFHFIIGLLQSDFRITDDFDADVKIELTMTSLFALQNGRFASHTRRADKTILPGHAECL
jgi:hypothetical protein